MEKTINVKVMEKFINLSDALEAIGIPSKIIITPDDDIILTSPLWNCVDGSGMILELMGGNDDDEIGHAVSPANCDYEELYERF